MAKGTDKRSMRKAGFNPAFLNRRCNMKIRRFLVVFAFTIIFLLSVSVYAGVGMTVKLPPPPDGVGNFVVGYMPKLGTYRLGSTSYDGDIYIGDGGTLVDSSGKRILFFSRYELVDGSWVRYTSGTSYWTTWYDDVSSVVNERGKVIVFSSSDFYGTKGQLLAVAATDDVLRKGVTLVGNQISSSKILLYMFYPFRQIILYILIVIVLVIAFYKAWKFVKGAF